MYVHKVGSLVDTTANPEKLDEHLGLKPPEGAISLLKRAEEESPEESSSSKDNSPEKETEKGRLGLPYPGPKRMFEFEKMKDVNKYWFTLQWISFNTPLGKQGLESLPVRPHQINVLVDFFLKMGKVGMLFLQDIFNTNCQ